VVVVVVDRGGEGSHEYPMTKRLDGASAREPRTTAQKRLLAHLTSREEM
jgi:hypothetical protein